MVNVNGISPGGLGDAERPPHTPSDDSVWLYGLKAGSAGILIGYVVVSDVGGVENVLIAGTVLRQHVNSSAAVVPQSREIVKQTFCVKSYSHTSSGDQTIELAPRMAASDSFSDE